MNGSITGGKEAFPIPLWHKTIQPTLVMVSATIITNYLWMLTPFFQWYTVAYNPSNYPTIIHSPLAMQHSYGKSRYLE